MVVVFFTPSDGRIIQCDTGPDFEIKADGRPFVEVDEYRGNWDVTHRVVNGALVPIS